MAHQTLDLHCTKQCEALGHRAAGSATHAERFILVELPLPWPDDIAAHPLLGPAAEPPTGDERPTRVLAVRSTETGRHQTDAQVVVQTARFGPDGFEGYVSVERSVPLGDVPRVVAEVRAGDLTRFESNPDVVADVLICTHGSRDRCCGQWGTLLFIELAARLGRNIRVWRTSHTGGHRFAPTGITFPDGLAWAWLDAPLVETIIDRSVEPIRLSTHLRGCAAFQAVEQVADIAGLAQHGWKWLDGSRQISCRLMDGKEFSATAVSGELSSGTTVVELDPVPVPQCGQPLENAKKTTPQFDYRPLGGDSSVAPAS